MKITKFSHSCLLIEEGSARILIDPGSWGNPPEGLDRLDAIFITHEHHDHYFPNHLRRLLVVNPAVKIYGNASIVELAKKENITVELLGHQQEVFVKGVKVSGWGEWHAKILETMPIVRNTGYFVADRLFYPGDVLNIPDKPVEILAYPAIAPWMNISDSLNYGQAIKPKVAFPVHDAFLKIPGPYYMLPEKIFSEVGIKWVVIEDGKSIEV